jgi:hypothetical protein
MTSADDLPPEERKRQREAMRRRFASPGLRPGLLQKYAAASSSHAKWEFLKAFMLDPQNLGSVQIEAEYVSLAEREDSENWQELPLETLRKQYTTEAEKAFLQKHVIDKQPGRAHPQAPGDENMRLYWVFKENADSTRNRNTLGTRVSGKGSLPDNKAARGALTDAVTGFVADFHSKGKGSGGEDVPQKGKKGGKKGPSKGSEKPKKAIPQTDFKIILNKKC